MATNAEHQAAWRRRQREKTDELKAELADLRKEAAGDAPFGADLRKQIAQIRRAFEKADDMYELATAHRRQLQKHYRWLQELLDEADYRARVLKTFQRFGG